jgi:hypothetical protein
MSGVEEADAAMKEYVSLTLQHKWLSLHGEEGSLPLEVVEYRMEQLWEILPEFERKYVKHFGSELNALVKKYTE